MSLKSEIKRINAALCHQDVLSVPLCPTPEQLKTAHRALARVLHPDRNPGNPLAADAMARVNVAYETLSDPKRRKLHDTLHMRQEKLCPKCGGKGEVLKQKGFAQKVAQPCGACAGTGKAPAV